MITVDDVQSEVEVDGGEPTAPAPLDPEALRELLRELVREELERALRREDGR